MTDTNQTIISEEDSDGEDERIGVLKSRFTLEDYLRCSETHQILEEERFQEFNDKLYVAIENFYDKVCEECNAGLSSALYYDLDGCHFGGNLIGLVYNNLKKKYNLQIFYDYPDLATPLITSHERLLKEEEEERLEAQRMAYGKTDNAHKEFDWASKMHKK